MGMAALLGGRPATGAAARETAAAAGAGALAAGWPAALAGGGGGHGVDGSPFSRISDPLAMLRGAGGGGGGRKGARASGDSPEPRLQLWPEPTGGGVASTGAAAEAALVELLAAVGGTGGASPPPPRAARVLDAPAGCSGGWDVGLARRSSGYGAMLGGGAGFVPFGGGGDVYGSPKGPSPPTEPPFLAALALQVSQGLLMLGTR
jgi:hypothetical protein